MATYPATAIVLRRTKLGESDLILTMLSAEGTIIRAVAKGARKPKSKLAGCSEFLRVSDLLLHTGRNLDVVAEARSALSFPDVGTSYRATIALSAFAEYLLKTHPDGYADARPYQLLVRLCQVVGESIAQGLGDDAADRLVTAATAKLLAMQGIRIVTDSCCLCGGELSTGGDVCSDGQQVGWSLVEGGALCVDCTTGFGSYGTTPHGACGWVDMLVTGTLADIAQTPIPAAAMRDVFGVVFGVAEAHADSPLRALSMYRTEVNSIPYGTSG